MPRLDPAVLCWTCSRPASVYALDETTGEMRPYCLRHGQEGALFRCERCGRYGNKVKARLILGHTTRPKRATASAKSTTHQLCPDCVTAMELEQPALFGEVIK